MRQINANQLQDLVADISLERDRLKRLEQEIQDVQQEIQLDPARSHLFYESLALKLHNFYTGCERIFRLVAIELNGGVPSSSDWHKRLLDRMTIAREGRQAMLRPETARQLQEFLGFRHIVRNLYGFELDRDRIAQLVSKHPAVWLQVEQDVNEFIEWLKDLAFSLEEDLFLDQ
ncbi:MAG: hypothetical protein HC771_25445 [Synechococcales cyanobacterium CRU_2_2]|nr:hypothetical protein [Synechococcales cyanobacterium CRU_2_2]